LLNNINAQIYLLYITYVITLWNSVVAPSGEWICSGARNSELKMLVWRE